MMKIILATVMFLGLLIVSTQADQLPLRVASLQGSTSDSSKNKYTPSACKHETEMRDGIKVAVINCGMGQTCEDGTSCCRLGGSVSCCDSNEKCVQGMCEPKDSDN